MDIKKIKEIYFDYCCDLGCLGRDFASDNKSQVIEIIKKNSVNWTKEYLDIIGNELLNSNSYDEVYSYYAKYTMACSTYEDVYNLSIILYRIINEKFLNEWLFLSFYNLIINTKNVSYKTKELEDSLIIYYMHNHPKEYNLLISMIKQILDKDIFKSDLFNKLYKIIYGI